MTCVGVFCREEMDKKPYLIHTLTQQTTIDSGGDNDLSNIQPFFLCPAARFKFQESEPKRNDYGNYIYEFVPFNTSPHFPNARSRTNQQGESSLLDCDENDICKFPVVPLFWCNNKELDDNDEFRCGACNWSMVSTNYYACLECRKMFHKECVESPLEIKHPSHPFHPLQLCNHYQGVGCICCDTFLQKMIYHCSICELSMHPKCAMAPIPVVIDHPKSHPHPLTFFPRQTSLACNICGLIMKNLETLNPTYICTQCVFVIHEDCIGFPYVIRISRHHHRISFTSSLPYGNSMCGVCRQQVDNNYGAYSCNRCDSYFVHSKCALLEDVWDGKELDGVPEEYDEIDDGEPFHRIADGIILHPCHSHHMQLEMMTTYDKNKYCRGCTLPIYEGQIYSCMKCDFILHESCAYFPRTKRHPLHPHPLKLNVAAKELNDVVGLFRCSVCNGNNSGFFYEHYKAGESSFKLDLRCASVAEPFEYQGHKHPLFLEFDRWEMERCQICKYKSYTQKLICLECNYIICFKCATLPYKARYKHDKHFLTICDWKEASEEHGWCEVCEGKILALEEVEECTLGSSEKEKIQVTYKCDDCCIALHVECLLGKDVYVKPCVVAKTRTPWLRRDENGVLGWGKYMILLNNSMTRPICKGCMRRCPYPIVCKEYERDNIFCSLGCLWEHPTS